MMAPDATTGTGPATDRRSRRTPAEGDRQQQAGEGHTNRQRLVELLMRALLRRDAGRPVTEMVYRGFCAVVV
jgi:hypothetical protein